MVSVRLGVVTFPGSLDDTDASRAVRLAGAEPVRLWHADRRSGLSGLDGVVLPGGFSYGDYLRAGAIARFAPIMADIIGAAAVGLPVLGICNGFQVLCEAHLLPGALLPNAGRRFVCRDQTLRVETADTAWTRDYAPGQEITVPIKHGDGRYVADAETVLRLTGEGQVVVRYVGGNPNGSVADIAGIANPAGNVVGLMPHPEHAVDGLTGPGTDGLAMFTSVLSAALARS
ncbi:MAG: phosphoribosylformylglycinamidine synthase subunit PurQ [Mycobacteriales bacterium]